MDIDMNKTNSWALAVGRLLMAVIFVAAGAGKVANFAGTQSYMQSMGIPGILLPLVILTELGGGLAILLGYKVRLVSVLLAGFCIVSGAVFHHNFSDQTQMIMFMKNLAMAGGFLALFVSGAGSVSLDRRLQKAL
jgi:putative oxidoreductase